MNTNVHMNLPNNFWVHLGGTIAGLGTNFCDWCARGGPALRNRSFGADLNQLWQAHPDNTLLIKRSYWFDR